jgi:hypothetical protein
MFIIFRIKNEEEDNIHPYEYMYVFSYQIFDENVYHNVHMNMDEYPNVLINVWIMLMNV